MDLGLSEQVVVVTGAAAGIGEATARLLVDEGAIVVGVDRAEGTMGTLGGRLIPILADLTDPGAAGRVAEHAMAVHGRIDGLVNNAGSVNLRTGFLDTTDADWDATFALNFHAARRMARAVLPVMVAASRGSLVHVTSESARLPDGHESDYATSKIALLGLSKALAVEFGPHGVRSNVVAPGPTRTAMWETPGGFGETIASFLGGVSLDEAANRLVTELRPLLTGRIGSPEDVARVIAYLISPAARQVTASEWAVDGGALRQV